MVSVTDPSLSLSLEAHNVRAKRLTSAALCFPLTMVGSSLSRLSVSVYPLSLSLLCILFFSLYVSAAFCLPLFVKFSGRQPPLSALASQLLLHLSSLTSPFVSVTLCPSHSLCLHLTLSLSLTSLRLPANHLCLPSRFPLPYSLSNPLSLYP